MTLDSSTFLIFFSILLLVYWNSSVLLRKYVLILTSFWFYNSLHPSFGLVIFWSLGITYSFGLLLSKSKNQQDRLRFGLISAFIISGTLVFFKYLSFWSTFVSKFIPTFELSDYLLPIGISFYTFQLIGYIVDVYKKKYPVEKDPFDFLLFVLFFPKLLAGPIERGNTLLPQIKNFSKWDFEKFISGCKLFFFGLFKKKVIADNLAIVVNRMFEHLPEYKGLSLIILMFLYSWQIYADFSGYTNMARGIARTLGFELLENFNTPYISRSVREFWKRWHISLSTWLRDYLYFPLGGSRKGLVITMINTFIVFIICGIWHGATLNFAIWGALHGLLIAIERLSDFLKAIIIKTKLNEYFNKISPNKLIVKPLQIAYTFSVITATWVIFRSPNLNDALYIFRNSLVGLKNFLNPSYVVASIELVFQHNILEIGITSFVIVIALVLEILAAHKSLNSYLNQLPKFARYFLYILIVTTLLLLRQVNTTEFIYVIF